MDTSRANGTLPSLLRLSPELIQRIASLGTLSSTLNLRLVCRAFYLICDSRTLFRNFIHNGNGLSAAHPSSPTWMYSELVLSMQQPVHVWARYALADEKARELSIRPVQTLAATPRVFRTRQEQVLPRGFEAWMPQLCVLHRRWCFLHMPFYLCAQASLLRERTEK